MLQADKTIPIASYCTVINISVLYCTLHCMGNLVNILYICAEVESPLEKYVAAALKASNFFIQE